jgi:glycerol-3-phosphate dehydrogenase
LVHGGLRYLKNAQIRLTFESVRERERLIHEARGLVIPLGCLIANFVGDRPPGWVFGAGLALYDLLALRWGHQHYSPRKLKMLCPPLSDLRLEGGFRYVDAQTDDARLVYRVIREAERAGGLALNYARAETLLRNHAGQVCGLVVRDAAGPEGQTAEARAPVVINATGIWADQLRAQVNGQRRLRPLRGSHLLFAWERLPITRAVSFLHPRDHRPVFALPWEGVTIYGTTDVDHSTDLNTEPAISGLEVEYLLEGVRYAFPRQELTAAHVFATLAGARPVVDTGNPDPSKESREHVLWDESGLLTVSGGKLTTFRLMARQALKHIRARLPHRADWHPHSRLIEAPPEITSDLNAVWLWRLAGRYGADAAPLVEAAQPSDLASIGDSVALWAELRWAARAERVVHLDDLLLRRVRLGLMLPRGGLDLIEAIRAVAQPELGWGDAHWHTEAARYAERWQAAYGPAG